MICLTLGEVVPNKRVPRELCAVELWVEFVCLQGILPGLREWKEHENVMIAIV